MVDALAPGIAVAVLVAFFVVVMAVPFIATGSRAAADLWRRVALLAGVVAYVSVLIAYTVLPLPSSQEMQRRCAQDRGAEAQLIPFDFVLGIGENAAASGGMWLVTDPVLGQVLANVLLFVPLGAGLRLLGHLSHRKTLAIALGISVAIEVSQGTGLWFVYDCAYRVMDVDDVVANTVGAAVGVAGASWVRNSRERS